MDFGLLTILTAFPKDSTPDSRVDNKLPIYNTYYMSENTQNRNHETPFVLNPRFVFIAIFVFLCFLFVVMIASFYYEFTNTSSSVNKAVNSVATPTLFMAQNNSFCNNDRSQYFVKQATLTPNKVCTLTLQSDDSILSLVSISAKLTNIQTLDIHETNDTQLPQEIGNLTSLSTLSVIETMHTTIPKEIGKLQNLQTLYMTGTDIKTLPSTIGDLPNLTKFILLSNLSLTNFPIGVKKQNSLTALSVAKSPSIHVPDNFQNFPNINTLYLQEVNLDEIPSSIYTLKKLTFLNFNNNHISTISAKINNLPTLTSLQLAYNMIVTMPAIVKLTKLVSLDLCNNKLTKLPEGIEKLKKLQYLCLKGNSIPASDIANLKKVLPQTQIVE